MFYAVAPFRSSAKGALDKTTSRRIDTAASLERTATTEELLSAIEGLVGLHEIKSYMEELSAFSTINEWRRHYRLRTDFPMHHMVFYGSPGTGKTTVARMLGKVLRGLGMLASGHVVEVERADLVGEYVGHTAQKTRLALNRARGGILFIDEAYALARGGDNDFGREAIDTLVKGMEEWHRELVVILAGYRREMRYFLSLNPGLSSRFPVQIEFPAFRESELVEIAVQMARDRDYRISADGLQALRTLLRLEMRSDDFGNGRTVRNLLEKAMRKQAQRIVLENSFDRERLVTLKASDFYGLA